MNKKIILCGTIIGILACLFPPFGSFYSGNLMRYAGLHFLFSESWMDKYSTYGVAWNYLCVELSAIVIATFGFAYYYGSKKK